MNLMGKDLMVRFHQRLVRRTDTNLLFTKFNQNPPQMEEEEMMVQQMRHPPRVQRLRQRMDHHPRTQAMVHQPSGTPFPLDAAFAPQQRFYSQQIPMDHHFLQSQHQMLACSSQSSLNSSVLSPRTAPRIGYGGASQELPMHCASQYDTPIKQLYPFQQSPNSGEWFPGMAPGAGGGSQQSQKASQAQPDPHLPPTGPTPDAQGDGSGMSGASMAAVGAGDGPLPQPGTSSEGQESQDIVQILTRRKLSGMQELAALRARRLRLEQEVSSALKEQHDAQTRSDKLNEEITRERNSLARALERETVLEQKLSAKREEAERVRAYFQMQAQFHERHVDSYCAEMTKMIETTRAAPELYEADNLKRVLEELKTEQQETNTELAEIDKELNLLREEYTALIEKGKNFDICSEKDLPNALQLLVDDMEKQLDEGEMEGQELEETMKSLEAEKEALTLRIKKLRERPLRTLVPRVSAYMTAASSSMTTTFTSHPSATPSRGPRMSCSRNEYSQ